MELWNKIFDKWQQQNVPNVIVREFEIGKYSPNYPWFSLKDKTQYLFTENPLNSTAYHLSKHLVDKDIELIAAYKIFAFLKYYSRTSIWTEVLAYAMNRHDEKLYNWWNANARYILPYTENCNDYVEEKLTLSDWEKLVEQSANLWKDVAKEWEIIKIPEHMDFKSVEYKNYQTFKNQIENDIEYQQYLRLKKKFEK